MWYKYKARWLYQESEQQIDILENSCTPMHELLIVVVQAVPPLPCLELSDLPTMIKGKITHISVMMYCCCGHPYEGQTANTRWAHSEGAFQDITDPGLKQTSPKRGVWLKETVLGEVGRRGAVAMLTRTEARRLRTLRRESGSAWGVRHGGCAGPGWATGPGDHHFSHFS